MVVCALRREELRPLHESDAGAASLKCSMAPWKAARRRRVFVVVADERDLNVGGSAVSKTPRRCSGGCTAESGTSSAGPAIAAYEMATSRTVAPMGPEWQADVAHRRFGMRECVGFRPTVPVNDAGIRMEPPPSLPRAMGTIPAATAAALPLELPPG